MVVLAAVNAVAGGYLTWYALRRDQRDEPALLALGGLLLTWSVVVLAAAWPWGDMPSGPAQWWGRVTAPQATLLAALGVGVVGGVTILQKLRNDRRDQWWKRAQWAIDHTLDEEERSQIVGWAAIAELSARGPATRQDRLLLRQVVDAVLDDAADAGDIDDTDEVVIEDGGDN